MTRYSKKYPTYPGREAFMPASGPYAGSTPFVRESDTSLAAAQAALPNAGTKRREVYDQILNRGGLIDDEIEVILAMRHQTVSARRRELVLLGLVGDSGKKRRTRSSRFAVVWEART